MKRKFLLPILFCFSVSVLFAQTNANAAKQKYLLIFRFKSDFKAPSDEAIKTNIKHWQDYMGELAQTGKLVSGFRPGNEGRTITGINKTINNGAYIANNELISSIIIVNASSIDDAGEIAKKCPIFEFDGSVEIRAMSQNN